MDDIKIALEMQRQFLGVGGRSFTCGCVVHVMGNFPKKPWIFIGSVTRDCSLLAQDGRVSVYHYAPGWYHKETELPVSDDEFAATWDRTGRRRYSVRGDEGVVVSSSHVALRAGAIVQRAEGFIDPIKGFWNDDTENPNTPWPPKLVEVMKWRKTKSLWRALR